MALTDRESDRFMLRLPDGMRDRIKAEAAVNGRSMNAEIVSTLEEKYPQPIENELHFVLLDQMQARSSDAEKLRLAKELRESLKNSNADEIEKSYALTMCIDHLRKHGLASQEDMDYLDQVSALTASIVKGERQ